jgi:hypothetical protein
MQTLRRPFLHGHTYPLYRFFRRLKRKTGAVAVTVRSCELEHLLGFSTGNVNTALWELQDAGYLRFVQLAYRGFDITYHIEFTT